MRFLRMNNDTKAKDNREERRVRFADMERIMNSTFLPWVMETAPVDYEAPKDPGALLSYDKSYTEKDFEGHREHTVYVGVHLPVGGVKRRSHHRRHKNKNSSESDDDDRPTTPPAQRVQFILGEDVDDGTHEPHPLFSEMGELVGDGDEMEWKETARWIKFEEDVEEGGNRWSKPHVATLSLHSLFELRSFLLNGTVMLDMEATSLEDVADLVLDNVINSGSLPADSRDKVREALLRRHRHQHERKKENSNNMSRLPLIRSLTEIGRSHSSSKKLQDKSPAVSSSPMPTSQTNLLDVRDHKGPYLAVPGTGLARQNLFHKLDSSSSLKLLLPKITGRQSKQVYNLTISRYYKRKFN